MAAALDEVVAEDWEEERLIVCYATTPEKAIELAADWAYAQEILDDDDPDDDCCFSFYRKACALNRIGFDDNLICSDEEDITKAVLEALGREKAR